MTKSSFTTRATIGTALAAILAATAASVAPAPALAQPTAVRPSNDVTLSVGTGRMVRLDSAMTDLFVANDSIADVQVRSANQVYIFGKAAGETTVFATDRAGRTVYSANVRVGNNIGSIDELLRAAMPDAQIAAQPINGMVLLTGTVGAPADVEEARQLVQAYVGEGTKVMSRLKTATPLQVMLKVTIAEVSRSVAREIGVNLLGGDNGSGFTFGIAQGAGIDPATGKAEVPTSGTALRLAGNLLGVDIISRLQLAEANGLSSTLAEPTIAALSGETAAFLAGGSFPIPVSSGINGTSVEFKEYGVSLAFTPTVLSGGRISMRVRPEVSELSTEGAIRLNGFEVPSLTTRRAETTVELGSGQSFMIGGLLRNNNANSVDKAPFLGDLPLIGALFRSNRFRRNETELVIVVTPYLVRPVNAGEIALPTDGYRAANDVDRVLGGQQHESRSGERRPGPVMATPTVAPGLSTAGVASRLPAPTAPAQQRAARSTPAPAPAPQRPSAAPGFSF
jgi:pilus assembly protein CpaC